MIIYGNHKRERGMAMRKKRGKGSWTIRENMNPTIKEVIQMKKRKGLRSWMCLMLTAMAVMGMSLLLVQVAGAASYTITVTQSPNGTISPGTSKVVGGTDKAFTITPGAGYAIATLTVDDPVQPARTYKFTKVTAAHSISATFAVDSDNDGIPDNVETQGINLSLPGGPYNYPPCGSSPPDRTACVDPATKDLFVVLVSAAGGYFSGLSTPLEYATKSVPAGGLPVTVHWIVLPEGYQDTSNRFLSPNSAEKYVRITESLDAPVDATVLGSSTCGTPDQDLGTVYTQRIVNHLTSVNAGASQDDINKYIKHTIAHELGHMVGPLAPVYNANYGGYHYPSEANDKTMNQFVYYTGTGSTAVFYIGTSYTTDDQAGIKLK
jgi:hypothetical protein